MRYERLWERLLEFLNEWSSATDVVASRITVEFARPDGSIRGAEIVMTADEWALAAGSWWTGTGTSGTNYATINPTSEYRPGGRWKCTQHSPSTP